MDGIVLNHSLDYSMGNWFQFCPEWNLQDIANPASDLLLSIIKHRATTSLVDQYKGVYFGRGDAKIIRFSVEIFNLQHAEKFPYWYTDFRTEENYGRLYD